MEIGWIDTLSFFRKWFVLGDVVDGGGWGLLRLRGWRGKVLYLRLRIPRGLMVGLVGQEKVGGCEGRDGKLK